MKRTLTANGLRQLIAFISRMTAADRAELEGVSAERAPQIVAGALVAEASMRALSLESVDICPWALREGLILQSGGATRIKYLDQGEAVPWAPRR